MPLKISIHYYSGVGNTEFIAKKAAKALKDDSYSVYNKKITEDYITSNIDDGFDMLGIRYNKIELLRRAVQRQTADR